jgi:hypothetical protein
MKIRILVPFVERLIAKDHLPHHFEKLIRREVKEQQKEVKSGLRKYVQIDFNKIYGWEYDERTMSNAGRNLLRNVILSPNIVNPILERDIVTNNVEELLLRISAEYEHQRKQVKKGLRKHISVDYNDLYC